MISEATTEVVPTPVTTNVMVQEVDAAGNAVVDAMGFPVMVVSQIAVLDADGNPVNDADGNPTFENETETTIVNETVNVPEVLGPNMKEKYVSFNDGSGMFVYALEGTNNGNSESNPCNQMPTNASNCLYNV